MQEQQHKKDSKPCKSTPAPQATEVKDASSRRLPPPAVIQVQWAVTMGKNFGYQQLIWCR